MAMTLKIPLITAALLALLFAAGSSEGDKKLDLKELEGDWEGVGEFLMPVTNVSMSLAGEAQFAYDSVAGHLRTSLTGEKYFFTYADSGHLRLADDSDSISWEVWDNFGKHALYHGTVDGNVIRGDRLRKKSIYSVTIELVTRDSIDFRLTVTEPDGDQFDKAVFNLWRVNR